MEHDLCGHANVPDLCWHCHQAATSDQSDGLGNAEPVVGGAAVLDDLRAFLTRFVAFPTRSASTAVALWAAHAHLVTAFESTPRLALLSPEPGSGKTRTLEVLELLVPRPMPVLNASTAAIFRSIQAVKPTLLLDEVDAVFGRHGKDDPAEDLRGLLNAGHRQGASIPRCVGQSQEVRQFPVFAAVALAGLGDLPDTLMSRSVIIRMRRRAPGERVEPFRHRTHKAEGEWLRERLEHWADSIRSEISDAWPQLPEGVVDRPADVWEPLLAVADAAGGHWPSTAREACVELVKVAETREASLGVRLLGDLRSVFGERSTMATKAILDALHGMVEAPWNDLRGKPLDTRRLARMLDGYGIGSTALWIDGKTLRGYKREDLWDAWNRYLPPAPAGPQGPQGAIDRVQAREPSARLSGAATSDLADLAELALLDREGEDASAGPFEGERADDDAAPCARCGWTVGSWQCGARCGAGGAA